jgi:hypothetical protein
MKKIAVLAVALIVVAGTICVYLIQGGQIGQLTRLFGFEASNIPHVHPRAAQDLPSIELAELVATAMPPNGFEKLGWDHLSTSKNIHWQTVGTATAPGEKTIRIGLARVTVAGMRSTVLRQAREELAWTLTLGTDASAKFGPKWITIEPGFDPGNQCFGTLYDGCTFTSAQALSTPKLKSRPICQFSDGTDQTEVFLITAEGRQPSVLVHVTSGGSGGLSSFLEVRSFSEQEALCKRSRKS